MCGNIPSRFAPLDDRGDRTNQLHLLKPSTFFFEVKQQKVGSSIKSTNVLKPEPIQAPFSINKF